MKRFEFTKEHPDAHYLIHNGSLITEDKAYLYLSSGHGPYFLVYDMNDGSSTFYRIMDEDGEPALMFYIFASPDGRVKGTFQSVSEENSSIYDLSSL